MDWDNEYRRCWKFLVEIEQFPTNFRVNPIALYINISTSHKKSFVYYSVCSYEMRSILSSSWNKSSAELYKGHTVETVDVHVVTGKISLRKLLSKRISFSLMILHFSL